MRFYEEEQLNLTLTLQKATRCLRWPGLEVLRASTDHPFELEASHQRVEAGGGGDGPSRRAPDPRSPPHRRSQSHRRRSPFRGDRQFIGHSSIMVIVDIYGHLFPSGHEAQADARILAISDGPETDKPGQT